jgi:YkoY family integral membrane protein
LGATPVFVDIRRDTFNIDTDKIPAAITPRTKAIIPVHLFGQCAEIDRICQIAAGGDIAVIEDAAQAIGAAYLIFLTIHHLVRKFLLRKKKERKSKEQAGAGFWTTVLKVELADIAFAVDSILAAIALSMTLPATNLPVIGGMDGGRFLVVFTGGLIGLIIMRFAASFFVKLLNKRPGLETAAYLVVGWVGVKLAVLTLAHEDIAILSEAFVHSTAWKVTFWIVLAGLFAGGWFLSGQREDEKTYSEKEIKTFKEEVEVAEEGVDDQEEDKSKGTVKGR